MKRRRGSIKNRGTKGSPDWYFVVDVNAPGEEREQRRRGGFRTRGEAQDALNDVLDALSKDSYVAPSKLTVGDYLVDEWLPSIRSSVRPSTLAGYQIIVTTYIVPAVGSVLLQQLTPRRLNGFYDELATSGMKRSDGSKGLSPRSIRNVHVVIRKALADALEEGHVARNVGALARPPKTSASQRVEMSVWNPAELHAFLDFVADDDLFPAWHVEANTGLRRGELLGLRWTDLDLDAGELRVIQNLVLVDYEPTLGSRRPNRDAAAPSPSTSPPWPS